MTGAGRHADGPASPIGRGRLPWRRRCVARVLWVLEERDPPLPELLEGFSARGGRGRALDWAGKGEGGRPVVRLVTLREATPPDLPVSVQVVSPRLLWTLLAAREDVLVVRELNLAALFAVASKALRARKVVALIEGDLSRTIGPTGAARWKVAFRRVVARFVDLFLANGLGATTYLEQTLGVPARKVVDGWWLAGFPSPPEPHPSTAMPAVERPLFLSAGRLVGFKGIDLMLEAFAEHRRRGGGGELWIVGEGPERAALERLVADLGVEDRVRFVGQVPREDLGRLLAGADAFLFPTLRDLVGRVVVESLTAGTPVLVSAHAGAAEALVQDGVNGLVVDPTDRAAFVDALERLSDPQVRKALAEGALACAPGLTPAAAAEHLLEAVARARA